MGSFGIVDLRVEDVFLYYLVNGFLLFILLYGCVLVIQSFVGCSLVGSPRVLQML